MARIKDISGQKFGRLIVLGLNREYAIVSGKKERTFWACLCDCGEKVNVRTDQLKSGNTKSCGCWKKTECEVGRVKHGLASSPIYHIYSGIKQRCLNSKNVRWDNYGGRGIEICDRWRDSFENFLEDMGDRPSNKHSIDRINNSLGYFKENCRWATLQEQGRNKRNNCLLEYKGQTKCVQDWAENIGIKSDVIFARLCQGWSIERTLTTPVKHKTKTRKSKLELP